jgi:VanZ family protein
MILLIEKLLKKPYFAYFATIIVAILCFMPSKNIPDITNDKTAHFVSFAGLSFLWMVYLYNYLKVIFGLSFFAFFIEIVQYLLPLSFHRGYDNYDILADVIGLIIGLVIFKLYDILTRKSY